MTAYSLPVFTSTTGAAAPAVAARDRALAAAREAAYHDGYLAGQAAATEATLADQTLLGSDLVEAISDARMTNEAARRHVTASLAGLVEALTDAIAPALAEAGIGAEIARLVARAVDAAPAARPRLRCAPELAPRIAALLEARGLDASVEAAPQLLPREAELLWDQGFDRLDLDACIAQIRECIASGCATRREEER